MSEEHPIILRTRARKAAGLIPDYSKTISRRIVVAAPQRPPCRFEGMLVERCPSCNKFLAEQRHVRECEKYDCNCTRGPNNGVVRCCGSCEGYEPVVDGENPPG